jgi:hypothetical protein
MRLVATSFRRALISQLHIKMLLLTILPFLVSLVIWGGILWWKLQTVIDWLYAYFMSNNGFDISSGVLSWFNMGALKTVVVPLLAMWAFLPLMMVTTLLFVALMVIPLISRHVGRRHYPLLEKKQGGTFAGSLKTTLLCFGIFAFAWIVTLPLTFVPPVAMILHPVLLGWLTYRIMVYDVLADYATPEEFAMLLRKHRWGLLSIGIVAGLFGAAPTLIWLGGVLTMLFFPLLAAFAIWLYVLVFIFSGLWFQYYCLEILARQRAVTDTGAEIVL